MKLLGLIGYPLGHSFSRGYFCEKFKIEQLTDYDYVNFPIETIEKFPEIIKQNPDLTGLNVTIPYKQQVMKYLDEIDDKAEKIGAVNTIKFIRKDNKLTLKGFNTDVDGFKNSLKPLLEPHHKKALILGTGGASKAIKFVLSELGIDYISASIENVLNEKEIRYSNIDENMIKERQVLIHATPLGTFPKIEQCVDIPYQYITDRHVLFDLVYNPKETLFMKKGLEKGAKCQNGLKMLHGQAEKAWSIWNY